MGRAFFRIMSEIVQWFPVREPVGEEVIKELMEKTRLVRHNGMVNYLVVSRNGFTTGCLAEMKKVGTFGLDLKDVKRLFERKK